MTLFHLSHIDLDGYGCQFVSKEYFKKQHFYNANYGSEIKSRLNQILFDIRRCEAKKILILITDLNLSAQEATFLEEEVRALDMDIKIQLLDHHASGMGVESLFEWYHLDTTRCATLITFEYLSSNYPKPNAKKMELLGRFTDMVNAIDMWLETHERFEFGKVCMRMVAESREINRFMFDKEHREYKFSLLKDALGIMSKNDAHIVLDERMLRLKKSYLRRGGKNDTIDNLTAAHLVYLLNRFKEECAIYYKGHKGLLTYNLGSISTIANEFLKQSQDFYFFMDVSGVGRVSIRSASRIDVSEMSKNLFDGGGHPNAAGGRIEGFKESFSYLEVKSSIEKIIKERENG